MLLRVGCILNNIIPDDCQSQLQSKEIIVRIFVYVYVLGFRSSLTQILLQVHFHRPLHIKWLIYLLQMRWPGLLWNPMWISGATVLLGSI